MALTRRQREVLDVIQDFIARNGYSPSLEEIGGALGLSSVATVHKHVSHLVEKGFVRRGWNQNRSIELVERSEAGGAVRLPLVGTIAAGRPVEAVLTAESLDVPSDMVSSGSRSFVLRVQGDSLLDEQVRNGDYLIVEERKQARDGETVVALVEGAEAALRRFYREGSTVRLRPAGSGRSDLLVPAERIKIQGVVTGIIRKY